MFPPFASRKRRLKIPEVIRTRAVGREKLDEMANHGTSCNYPLVFVVDAL
jgi:hypothetical protein